MTQIQREQLLALTERHLEPLALGDASQALGEGIEESPLLLQEGAFVLFRSLVEIADFDGPDHNPGNLDWRGLFPSGLREVVRAEFAAPDHNPGAGDVFVLPAPRKDVRQFLVQLVQRDVVPLRDLGQTVECL